MSAGVAAAVVVCLLLLAAVAGYFFWKRWVRYRSTKTLMDWAGANMDYNRLEAGTRQSSVSSLLLSEVQFSEYVCKPHGFKVAYPKDWSVNASRSPDAPILVQFSCAHSERMYKTFTVVGGPVHVPPCPQLVAVWWCGGQPTREPPRAWPHTRRCVDWDCAPGPSCLSLPTVSCARCPPCTRAQAWEDATWSSVTPEEHAKTVWSPL